MLEKAVLVGTKSASSLEELASLARTAGAIVCTEVVQKRPSICASTYIGKGKAHEVKEVVESESADLVIFDDELTGSQVRNLENIIGKRVIDRTELILDIFAQHANTVEARLQVELAQLLYLLPRLRGKGVWLSRLGGGIGTRGPGETALEIDRRKIDRRIIHLRRKLKEVARHRKGQRKGREGFCTAAIVGYTNSGKSTLLNALCNTTVCVEDKLFATLDPKVGRLSLPNGAKILLVDTVGFINRLPHHLVAAFSATLEEVREADILLHVVDASSQRVQEQIDAVIDALHQLKVEKKPTITVFNKIDKLPSSQTLKRLLSSFPNSVAISALKQEGLDKLLYTLCSLPQLQLQKVRITVSADGGQRYKRLLKFAARVEKRVYKKKIVYDLLLPKALISPLLQKGEVSDAS
jgi:GTP-binding protein HflX